MFWERRTRIPLVSDSITRDRFLQLRKYLKVVDDDSVTPDQRSKDRFWKIRPMASKIANTCKENKRCKEISIDEQMILIHGQLPMKQYVWGGEPNPTGLKVFVACSPNGLPLDLYLYEGKNNILSNNSQIPKKLDVGGRVVLKLCDSFPDNAEIYIDRYFTSIPLLDILSDRNIDGT